MLPAWVMGFADGSEVGAYLALDLGGTNLRVCNVVLSKEGKFVSRKEGRKYDMIQSKYRLVPLYFRHFADCSPMLFVLAQERSCLTISRIVWQVS